ncbi:putative bifunctional diguanylate cyclase/phosphodiesterase [Imhoffiella purpurea]|uniref:Diguanylate cyclase n=1 Tax=Imhoffiella purpurea TaxID=1249627 RepID=W9VAN1_9GAMM|nr:EAL domain-containing protein [Imhoffiella purpurea]EXJ13966.1 diguanylate cyclase [Imhoffiella purpurea]
MAWIKIQATPSPDAGLNESVPDLGDHLDASLDSIPENLTLDDILDREEAQRFQDAFANATGVASIITYPDGRPFTRPSNFCRLCSEIIRKTQVGLANCMRSNAEMGSATHDGPVIGRCLSGGLADGGCRIQLGGRHVGNWLIGQVLCDDISEGQAVSYARRIGVDSADYLKALGEVVRMPVEQFERVTKALALAAAQLSNAGLKNLILARQVERLSVAEHQLQRMALNDALTGLPNRVLAKDRLRQAISQAQRAKDRVAVLFIDLDQFKQVNDTRGHSAGDALLCEAAGRLRGCCRAADTVARLGGDEFMIVLPMQSSAAMSEVMADKIVQHLSAPFSVDGHLHHVTASIGIAIYPDDALSGERLLSCADIAMYRVKSEGRNGYRRYRPEMNTKAMRQASLEDGLDLALQRHEFVLEFQSIHRVGSACPVGIEALPRWQHPTLGRCLPSEFVPLAEETGTILEIGAWVLEQACREAMTWPRLPDTPFVAVNLSAEHLSDPGFLPMLDGILERTGFTPGRLCLEFTEDIVIAIKRNGGDVLKRLRKRGVWIAIDHFGVGSVALSQLRHFPINLLKIDSVFIRDLPQSAVDRQLVSAIATLGRNLAIQVVAQGVETEAQAVCLESCGCELMQGYWTSPPVDAAELRGYLDGLR